jgi:rubrerythrin
MGCLFEWRCRDCGAGESFFCGGGFSDFNPADAVEQSKRGDFGPALKALLGNDIPRGWSVLRENSYYECPFCGGVVLGTSLQIEDGSNGWLEYHAIPDKCPSCGESLQAGECMPPMSEGELSARCEGFASAECPKCGSKNVSTSYGSWD